MDPLQRSIAFFQGNREWMVRRAAIIHRHYNDSGFADKLDARAVINFRPSKDVPTPMKPDHPGYQPFHPSWFVDTQSDLCIFVPAWNKDIFHKHILWWFGYANQIRQETPQPQVSRCNREPGDAVCDVSQLRVNF